MLNTYCKVELVGRIGREGVEEKNTADGKKFWVFDIATERQTVRDNKPVMTTDWHSCVCSDDRVKGLGLKAGDAVMVEGALIYRDWEDKRYVAKKGMTDANNNPLPEHPKKQNALIRVSRMSKVVVEKGGGVEFGEPVPSGSIPDPWSKSSWAPFVGV